MKIGLCRRPTCGHAWYRHRERALQCEIEGCSCPVLMWEWVKPEMTSEDKQAFVNDAEQAVVHPLVLQVMEEFADNMGFELKGLPKYGLMKVASYTATIARAYALGIDPDVLRHTPEEANSALLRKAARMVYEGVPTIVIEGEDGVL